MRAVSQRCSASSAIITLSFGLVCSLIGVILIARPTSLFGKASQESAMADGTFDVVEETGMAPVATPAQRLAAVG